MNFLGHLYFSGNDYELMYANLFGDSVKGKQFLSYPESIRKGILLHRRIDAFIDEHQLVKELKRFFYKDLPKVSPVAIDLFFDHLLARYWENYHDMPYALFLESFYTYSPIYWDFYPDEFRQFVQLMCERKWLNSYPLLFGLEKSCEGVSLRISFPNSLFKAPITFVKNEEIITTVFHTYMSDAKIEFAEFLTHT
jgi:acyl carrier protein phosphodiesterase